MKYHARDYFAVLGSHAALLLAVYTWMLAGLPEPEAGALTVYVHIVLSGVFCLVCMSRWGGFAATAAMTLLLFGLLVFPFFGMDALAVWESVREGVSNGVHALLGILYA